MRTTTAPITLAFIALIAAGCGSDDKPSAAADAAPAASQPPYGTYTRTLTQADLDRTQALRDESGPNQETPPTGELRLTIAKGSGEDVLKVALSDGFSIGMVAGVEDSEVKLFSYVDPMQASYCGPQAPEAAAYSYELDGETLVMKPAHADGCADRDAALTGSWKRG